MLVIAVLMLSLGGGALGAVHAGDIAGDASRPEMAGAALGGPWAKLRHVADRDGAARRLWRRIPRLFKRLPVAPGLGGAGRRSSCLAPGRIHSMLRRQGWWKFHRLRVGRHAYHVNALRPNGSLYELKVDKCTGRVLSARRLKQSFRGYGLWPK